MPEATNDVVWAWIGTGSPWTLLWLWLALINLVTFLVFALTSSRQNIKRSTRAPAGCRRRRCFLLAALGGSVGALLGMRVWRHKTLHRSFRIGIPLILAVQILIPAGLWLYWNVVR